MEGAAKQKQADLGKALRFEGSLQEVCVPVGNEDLVGVNTQSPQTLKTGTAQAGPAQGNTGGRAQDHRHARKRRLR